MQTQLIKKNYLNQIKQDWLSSNPSFPSFLTPIPKEKKEENEQYIQAQLIELQTHIKSFKNIPIGLKKWKRKSLSLISTILYNESVLGIHNFMNAKTLDAFQEEIKEFLRHVRQFSPELSLDSIGQAIRNYIVYGMFKEIHEEKSSFHLGCFGYSMLYPFTDNYIDSLQYSDEQKAHYNQMIRDKIMGNLVHPMTEHEQKTCELLDFIEQTYQRELHPEIFELLLLMLDAQVESIRQQNHETILTLEERLDISCYKGGISVFIDRYFVHKPVTTEDMKFYLSFGLFLQLADDLQDIKEDYEEGNQTIFTVDLHNEVLEQTVNKMLHFIHQLIHSYQAPNEQFKTFVLSNCDQLIYTSIHQSKEFFSKEYLERIEQYLIVSFAYLETLKKETKKNNDVRYQEHYMKVLDTFLFD